MSDRKNHNSVIFFIYGYKNCPYYQKSCQEITARFPNVSCIEKERGKEWKTFLSKNKKLIGSHTTSPVILYENDHQAVFIGGWNDYKKGIFRSKL